jgi:hypothetical protein
MINSPSEATKTPSNNPSAGEHFTCLKVTYMLFLLQIYSKNKPNAILILSAFLGNPYLDKPLVDVSILLIKL